MDILAQTSWLESDEMAVVTGDDASRNYFSELLHYLHVDDHAARWPDTFGQELQVWASKTLSKPVQILSLFSGGGGLDIAFHDVGFHAVQMVEIDSHYVETLQANAVNGKRFEGTQPLCIDIRAFDPPDDLQIDFIIGGPPCQTFSAAGRRAAGVSGLDDRRGMLFQEYIRILRKLQPAGFLFENVAGITGAQDGKAWKEIRSAFETIGYTISYRVLDAADYGVPQHRERLIIVGTRGKPFTFPRPTHGPDSCHKLPYYLPTLAVHGVTDEKPSAIGGRYGHLLEDIPPGLNYSFYTEEMGHPTPHFAWRSKFSDILYKADPHMPIRTLKAQGGQYTGPFHWENRPFSIGELKRLQTFPDDYAIVGGRLLAIQQIGNSVPPQFGRVLALAILDQLFDVHFPVPIDYLLPDEELSFRQNKRFLTALYRKRATEAINRLYPDRCGVNVTSKYDDTFSDQADEKPVSYNACLGPLFSWHVQNHQQQNALWNIQYSIQHTKTSLNFQVQSFEGSEEDWSTVIEIWPTQNWILPYEKVNLQILEPSLPLITAAWKAFEHYLAKQGLKADLVQLNGYYQYEPRMKMKVLPTSLPLQNKDFQQNFIVLHQVLEGIGVRQMIGLSDLATIWHVPTPQIIDTLLMLRSLGYEVRSEFTNNQIPQGHILIPYAFPTFNPNSVQMRKELFPPEFIAQAPPLLTNTTPRQTQGLWT